MKYCIIFAIILQIINAQTYKAVVMDYAPRDGQSTFIQTIMENLDTYQEKIRENIGSDIIVFPEYGLTTTNVFQENLADLAIEVPKPDISKNLCNGATTKILKNIACASEENRIYVVINLLEKENNKIYNTNLVFGRNGALVARYRKINLFGLENGPLTAGTELVTFKTDFGVTFGIFTCYDILFNFPATDILKDVAVTDIIFTTAWMSEVPFLTALQVQDGYSKWTGANLLASGYSAPRKGSGGSGIYVAESLKSVVYIPKIAGITSRKVEVIKLDKRVQHKVCNSKVSPRTEYSETRLIGGNVSITNFITLDDLDKHFDQYTFKSFEADIETHTLCSKQFPKFCCEFEIELEKIEPHPIYSSSVKAISDVSGSCAIISCEGKDPKTCARRTPNTKNVTFKKMIVKANMTATYLMPSTLSYDLVPIADYTFCTPEKQVIITNNERQTGVITFGFYTVSGSSGATTFMNGLNIGLVFLLSLFIINKV